MTDDHRLKTAVPCLRCKRSTKNASQICSNHRNVSTEAGSISPALTSLSNRNTNKQDIEQRNIDFITNAPVVSVEGHSAIIDEAFTLGSALTDDNGETFMTDLYAMEATNKGRLIRQDNRLIIEAGTADESREYAEEVSQELWSQAVRNYRIECETYQDVAQAASQFESDEDIDYRSTRDGKLKVIFKDRETNQKHGVMFTPKSDEYEQITEDRASGTTLDEMNEATASRNARKLSELQFITDIFHDCGVKNEDGSVSIPSGWYEV